MAIIVKKEPDVHVTEEELRLYRDQWKRSFTHFVGTPPSLEEFIRQQKSKKIFSALSGGRG